MPNNISASAQVTLLNPLYNLVFSLEDNSNPGVSIETKVPVKPYGNPIEVTFDFNCINGHLYSVLVWESPVTTPTGVVRCSYSRGVAGNTVQFRDAIYAEVGVTPNWTAGSATVIDSTFAGWDIEELISNPYYLVRDTEPNNTQKEYSFSGTTITLLLGRTLGASEQWKVTFKPLVISAQPGVPSSPFGTGRIITDDENLTAASKNQALICQGSGTVLKVGLPPLSGMTDFTDIVYLFSNGGNHKNVEIIGVGSDKINYNGSKQRLWLGQVEQCGFFKAFASYWPLSDLPGMRMVGEILYNHSATEINTLQCNGAEYLRADYPRLWAYVQTIAAVVSQVTWDAFLTTPEGYVYYPNKGNFSTADGSTNFRVPLITNVIKPSTDSGVFDLDAVLDHYHTTGTETDSGSSGIFRRGLAHIVRAWTGFTSVGGFAASTGNIAVRGASTENKVRTISTYCLIRY